MNEESYNYEYVYNNEDFRILLNNSYVSLSNKNNIIFENNIVSFVKYVNPLLAIKNKYELNMNYISDTSIQNSRMINFNGIIGNNEIYMISHTHFKDTLDTKYLKYYFPLKYVDKISEIENIDYVNNSFIIREKYGLNYTSLNLNKNIKQYIKSEKCYLKHIEFHLNSDLYMEHLTDNEMLFCFNKFKSFYDLPVIHISYNNRNSNKYKINKPFLEEQGRHIVISIVNKKNINYIKNNVLTFINFRYYINNIYNIIDCYLFSNGYFHVSI